jgi:hypothetical protein
MGVTYDQDFIDMAVSADETRQAVPGQAHHSYFAQTVARNLNHCCSEKTAPVLLTFYQPTSSGWSNTSLTVSSLGPRGRSLIWRPHYAEIILMAKVKRNLGSGTGTLTMEVWEQDQYTHPTAAYGSAVASTTAGSWEAKSCTVTTPDIAPGRVVSIYLTMLNIDLLFCTVYAGKYSG